MANRAEVPHEEHPGGRPGNVRRLLDDTRIVFLSDSHIGGDPGRDIFESPAELTALLDELTAFDAPVELVLAGDFFDFLEIGDVPAGADRASVTIARPEYREVFAALRRFGAGAGRRVVYLPGNHDAEVWWNPAVQETLRRAGLAHEFVPSYAACFASRPDQIVYCEHGNQFDPANAITRYDDPLDTPLGHHIVTDVMRRIVPASTGPGNADGNEDLRDVNKVYPLVAIPELLAGRLFYDLLTQVVRWVLLPLFFAYAAFRILAYAIATARDDALGFWQSARTLPGAQRLFLEIGYDALLLLTALAVLFVVLRRLAGRFVSSTAARLPGLSTTDSSSDRIRRLLKSDRAAPMSGGLLGREMAVFVSGHTHAPSLVAVARRGGADAVAVNSGCWLRQLRPVPARGGGPAVFVSTFVLTHVRIYRDGSLVRVELWEHPKPARRRLRLAERIAILGRLPAPPAANAAPRIVAAAALPQAAASGSLLSSR